MRLPDLWSALPLLGRAAVDLAFGACCAGCGGPPGLLCPACHAALLGPARPVRPDPAPPGLPPVHAVAPYAGVVRAVLAQHKERGRLALAAPLGGALATSVRAALAARPDDRPAVLVPVPSSPGSARRRGHDPLLRTVRRAAVDLRGAGVRVAVVPAIVHRRRVADQAGLDRVARGANLAGAMAVRPRAVPLLRGVRVVVVDDVMTTGATLVEARRALAAAGFPVGAAAVVAATARRRSGTRVGGRGRSD